MAQYKTDIEAGQKLSAMLSDKSRELRTIYDSKDPKDQAKAEKLKAEIGGIQNSLMMLSGTGAFGGGIAKGITSIVTGIPDLVIGAKNIITGSKDKSLTDRMLPGIESVSQEHAGAYGLGHGLGSSTGMGKLFTGLNTTANLVDEKLLDGSPVAQTALGVGLLGVGGTQLALNGVQSVAKALKGRQVQKLMSQLPPEEASIISQYALKGQTSTDPVMAGKIENLRNNPKFKELFDVLDQKAAEVTTKGLRAETNPNYNPKDAGVGIYEGVAAQASKLKEDVKTGASGAYKKANEYAGSDPVVPTTNTVAAIDKLIAKYSDSKLSDSDATVKFLEKLKGGLTEGATAGQPELLKEGVQAKFTVPQLQAWLTDFGSKAKGSESLITDVSVNTQKQLAAQIFGGVKDDLRSLTKSSDVNERAIGNLLTDASTKTRKAVENYNNYIAQGLPKQLHDMPLAAVDTEQMLGMVKKLSNDQRDALAGVLKDTAPDDLNRIRQVMYDDVIGSVRNAEGKIDLQALAVKYNKMKAEDKQAFAFAVGDKASELDSRMNAATGFFRSAEISNGHMAADKVNPAEVGQAAYAVTGGSYTGSKLGQAAANIWNHIKGGVNDEQALSLLLSPEAKGVLRDAITNPNSVKTLQKIENAFKYTGPEAKLFPNANEVVGMGSRVKMTTEDSTPRAAALQLNLDGIDLNGIDLPTEPSKEQNPLEQPSQPNSGGLNLDGINLGGVAPKFDPNHPVAQQIRTEAEKQGYGKYADLLVKQAYQESRFDPYATSHKGAGGVFQHMPGTAKDLNIDPYDLNQSISGGVKYMGQQLDKFKDPRLALAAYNWGPANVAKSGLAGMPKETEDYINRILGS